MIDGDYNVIRNTDGSRTITYIPTGEIVQEQPATELVETRAALVARSLLAQQAIIDFDNYEARLVTEQNA